MRSYGPPYARLEPAGGELAFCTSYDAALIAEFKAKVPAEARRWEPTTKRWLVRADYGSVCAALAQSHLNITVAVPSSAGKPTPTVQLIKLEYLGRCKLRESGEASAYGWANDGWTTIWPEPVLREWFEAEPQRPDERPTYFAVLGVKQSASTDDVRAAYRRLAKQWHPDVAKEADAAEVFKSISNAYQVLTNDMMRRKYEAGLALEAAARQNERWQQTTVPAGTEYRAPLKCGYVLAEGINSLGRFVINRILQFEDITDGAGRTMTTSWAVGADHFETRWV